MIAAVIGVIGVIAGVLATASLNHRAERGRRRALACVAEHLIAAELEQAATRMQAAADDQAWWPADFSNAMWKEHAGSLAMEAPPDLVRRLSEKYVLLELRDRQRKEKQKANKPPSAKLIQQLIRDQEVFRSLAGDVRKAVSDPAKSKSRKPLQVVGVVGFVAIAVTLFIAALVPREQMTDATISAALEQKLGASAVGCSHVRDRWHCEVSYSRSGRTCGNAAASAGEVGPAHAELAVEREANSCGRAPPVSGRESVDVSEGPDDPIATSTSVETEIDLLRDGDEELDNVQEESLVERVKNTLFPGN